MLGVTFENKHSYNDWGVWLEDMHINPPLPKRYIVDVPARNGLLDLTPELTPTIRFENRTLTFNFRVKAGDWSTLVSQIYGDIHGRTLDVVSDLDPNWHWHGCVTVDDFSSDERTGKLVITVDADPFKLSNTENSYTVNGNGTITCVVDRMEISPAFELTAPTTVIYGDSSYAIESTATTEKTLSGDIVSFADGTANPAVDLTADITAQQDLHGYDHPWVGGAGKNISPISTADYSSQKQLTTINTSVQSYYTYSAVASNTGTGAGRLVFQVYNGSTLVSAPFTEIPVGTSSQRFSVSANLTNTTFDKIILVGQGAVAGYNVHLEQMQLERNATMTDYEPYENICPIDGFDEVAVNVTGKNLLVGGLTWGNIDATGADSGNTHNYIRTINYSSVKPSTTYYIHVNKVVDSGSAQLYSIEYDEYKNIINRVQRVANNTQTEIYRRFITTPNTAYVRFFYWKSTVFDSYDDMKIWLTTEETTPYEPYNGQTYTIDLDGTRYGGTLDVTTGVLTVTHAEIDLGTLGWIYTSSHNGIFYADLPSDAKLIVGTDGSICSNYAPTRGSDWQYLSNGEYILRKELMNIGRCAIAIRDDSYTNSTDFKNALTTNNAQLVYELATPQMVQLTAEQVMILKNQNNIWADSGDVEVTYLAQDFAGKTFYIPDLELAEGSHELTIQGTGTTTVTYTNGRL